MQAIFNLVVLTRTLLVPYIYWDDIGQYKDYMGIMENKMETTIKVSG